MSFGHYGDHMVHEPGERVKISPLAGKPAPRTMLVDLVRLEREYYERQPDPGDSTQLVRFGTSGHRGSPLHGSFTEAHILAITQAICDYRRGHGIEGPLYMGKDTHGVSGPAQRTAVEVLAANGVDTIIQRDDGVTPTPVISRAILAYNRGRTAHLADGIVVTPSHNPPEDGGFKYTPPRRPRRDRRHAVGPGSGERALAHGQCRRQARAIFRGHQGDDDTSGGSRPAVRGGP
jgi:alpha-D-glucose phosphate-specific phosphoglucomutase